MSEEILKQILAEVTDVNTGMSELNKTVSELKTDGAGSEEKGPSFIQAIFETRDIVIEIKERLNYLEEIQKDQQRILEVLSARSIQHESKLRRI